MDINQILADHGFSGSAAPTYDIKRSFTVAAGQTINVGDVVQFNASGQVIKSALQTTRSAVGAETVIASGSASTSSSFGVRLFSLGDGVRFLAIWTDKTANHTFAAILSVNSNNTITTGTVLDTGFVAANVTNAVLVNPTTAVIYISSNTGFRAMALNINNTTITAGSQFMIDASATGTYCHMAVADNSTVIALGSVGTTTVKAYALNVSGSTLTLLQSGTQVANISFSGCALLPSGNYQFCAMIGYPSSTNNEIATYSLTFNTGNNTFTVSAGMTLYDPVGSGSTAFGTGVTNVSVLSGNRYAFTFGNGGVWIVKVVNGSIAAYNARLIQTDAMTPGWSLNNTIPSQCAIDDNGFLFVWQEYQSSTYRTMISTMFTDPTNMSETNLFVAGKAKILRQGSSTTGIVYLLDVQMVSRNKALLLFVDPANSNLVAKLIGIENDYTTDVTKAVETTQAQTPCAIAITSASSGGSVTVQFTGVVKGLSGLQAGDVYYADINGNLTTTPTQFKIGYALSSTDLLINGVIG
jgi:hypothetical protein